MRLVRAGGRAGGWVRRSVGRWVGGCGRVGGWVGGAMGAVGAVGAGGRAGGWVGAVGQWVGGCGWVGGAMGAAGRWVRWVRLVRAGGRAGGRMGGCGGCGGCGWCGGCGRAGGQAGGWGGGCGGCGQVGGWVLCRFTVRCFPAATTVYFRNAPSRGWSWLSFDCRLPDEILPPTSACPAFACAGIWSLCVLYMCVCVCVFVLGFGRFASSTCVCVCVCVVCACTHMQSDITAWHSMLQTSLQFPRHAPFPILLIYPGILCQPTPKTQPVWGCAQCLVLAFLTHALAGAGRFPSSFDTNVPGSKAAPVCMSSCRVPRKLP